MSANRADLLPVAVQLAEQPSGFSDPLAQFGEGGTSAADLALARMELDNLAVALAFGQRGLEGSIGRFVAQAARRRDEIE